MEKNCLKDYYETNSHKVNLSLENLKKNTSTCSESISSQFRIEDLEFVLTFDNFFKDIQQSRENHNLHTWSIKYKFQTALKGKDMDSDKLFFVLVLCEICKHKAENLTTNLFQTKKL